MGTVTGAVWAVTASMWVLHAICGLLQALWVLLNKTKSPDSSAVKAFQVEEKIEKKIYPISETPLPGFRNSGFKNRFAIFSLAVAVGSKGCVWAVTASLWAFKGAMGTVKGPEWDVNAICGM